jgi:PAS domain-containing protein
MHEVKNKLLKSDSILTDHLRLELLKQACEFSVDGFCILNEEQIIIDANNAFCKIFDITIDSIKNTKLGNASTNLKNFNLEVQKAFDLKTLTLKTSHSAFIK